MKQLDIDSNLFPSKQGYEKVTNQKYHGIDKYDIERYIDNISIGTFTYCAIFDDASMSSDSDYKSFKATTEELQYPAIATFDIERAKNFYRDNLNLKNNLTKGIDN